VLNIVPLAGCKDEVDAAILELPVGRSTPGDAAAPDRSSATG
jgi:hypothetical protein